MSVVKYKNKILIELINNTYFIDGELIDFDLEIKFLNPIFIETSGEYIDMFACDYDNTGFDSIESWKKQLAEYSSGKYELHYNYSLVRESWEMPHIQYAEYEDFELVPLNERQDDTKNNYLDTDLK